MNTEGKNQGGKYSAIWICHQFDGQKWNCFLYFWWTPPIFSLQIFSSFFFHLFPPLIFPPRYRLVFNSRRHSYFDILPQKAIYTDVNTFSKTASTHSILSPRKRQVNPPLIWPWFERFFAFETEKRKNMYLFCFLIAKNRFNYGQITGRWRGVFVDSKSSVLLLFSRMCLRAYTWLSMAVYQNEGVGEN